MWFRKVFTNGGSEMIKKTDEYWKKDLNQLLVDSLVHPNVADNTKIGFYYYTKAPNYLYKYYGDRKHNIDAVFNNKMWYSAPVRFNDPYDCDFAIDEPATIDSLLQSIAYTNNMKRGSEAWKNACVALKKAFPSFRETLDTMKSSIGIACLSESFDTMLMWSHYANNHKGMCVEYNLMDFVTNLNFTPIPVIYSNEKSILEKLRINSIDEDILGFFLNSIVHKDTVWEYENEWRIVRDNNACGEQWDNGRQGALLNSVRPVSVILGCNAEPEFEKEVIGKCNSEGIRVCKMVKGTGDYGMSRVEL